MPTGKITVETAVNANIKQFSTVSAYVPSSNEGYVPSAVANYVTAEERGFGSFRQVVLTLAALPLTVVNGTEYQSAQIYQFPEGRMLVLGTTASIAETTTSAIASTINSGVTMAFGIGTAAASNVALTSTMVDLLPSTNLTTSTTINVAGAAVGAALAASAHFDGTTTAKKAYLNTGFATTTDVDADGTMTLSGTVTLTWVNLGDY